MSEYTRNSSDVTADVMSKITTGRCARGYSRAELASMIETEYGYRITEDQYRACEQGLTRKVPLDVIIYAAKILDLDSAYVFGDVIG